MFLTELVLVRAFDKFATGVDEQHVLRRAPFLEKQNHSGNPRAEEQLLRQTDDRIQQIFLNQRLADAS